MISSLLPQMRRIGIRKDHYESGKAGIQLNAATTNDDDSATRSRTPPG
jgi:hypothetical protein